jgi:hypothetical protein
MIETGILISKREFALAQKGGPGSGVYERSGTKSLSGLGTAKDIIDKHGKTGDVKASQGTANTEKQAAKFSGSFPKDKFDAVHKDFMAAGYSHVRSDPKYSAVDYHTYTKDHGDHTSSVMLSDLQNGRMGVRANASNISQRMAKV